MNKNKVLKKINPLFLKGICHRGLHNKLFIENSKLLLIITFFEILLSLYFLIYFLLLNIIYC